MAALCGLRSFVELMLVVLIICNQKGQITKKKRSHGCGLYYEFTTNGRKYTQISWNRKKNWKFYFVMIHDDKNRVNHKNVRLRLWGRTNGRRNDLLSITSNTQ